VTFRKVQLNLGAAPQKIMTPTFQLSRDSQALFITAVTKDRLPVFKTDALKVVTCQALDEARKSGGFLLFAYVIMPNHVHLLTDCPRTSADVLRRVKGLTARRVIDYLKGNDYRSSLAKLRHTQWKRKHTHSLWQQEKNVLSIFSEGMFMQKVNYIHLNPVRAELVNRTTDYRWSSARVWRRLEVDDEPLKVDFDRIAWRRA
jgi:REP element-mobilizing transposase RayT